MKYVKIDPFEKHLEEALPEHPSPLYFIAMSDPFERRFVAERMVRRLGLPAHFIEGENLLEELESPSLFGEKRILVCDESTAKELQLSEEMILILMGKNLPPAYKKMEKEAVTLDLSGEKPWDRKSRLQRWLLEIAFEGRKTLAVDAVTYLLEFSHSDFAPLAQEVAKAMVYAGDEKTITLAMVKEICTLDPTQNGWELSEAVVWGGRAHFGETDLYSLVGQIRYQLQLGLQIASGKEGAKVSPKKRDKIQAQGFKATFYLEGLKDLFDLELKMRSGISNQELLFDTFRAKLAVRRG